jgi:hypothetical protein
MFMHMDIANSLRQTTYIAALELWSKAEEGKRGPAPEQPEMLRYPGWVPEVPEMSDDETLIGFFGSIGGF